MDLIFGILVVLLVMSLQFYFSTRPPKKLNTTDLQLVSRTETGRQIIEEYTDGKHTIRNYILKPLNMEAIKQESKKEE